MNEETKQELLGCIGKTFLVLLILVAIAFGLFVGICGLPR